MELSAYANGHMVIPEGEKPPKEMGKRVREAHGKARDCLKTSALLTDVYFHFTPSQIMFSSLLLADPELTSWYLATKNLPAKVMEVLRSCAALLTSSPSTAATEIAEIKRLEKKLRKCQNPEMVDLVKLNERKKREGGEEGLDEKVVKKRKLERDRMEREGEELFGPAIGMDKDMESS